MSIGNVSIGNRRKVGLAFSLSLAASLAPINARAAVPHGTEDGARIYYQALAGTLGFSTADAIFQTTLNDVATYLGYAGVTGADLQDLPAAVLMTPDLLLAPCTAEGGSCLSSLRNREAVVASLGAVPIRPDDILVSSFFAPKIMNVRDPETTRQVGWRKLVRLRARAGSGALIHHIASGIVLFNFFTSPGSPPFAPGAESVNTQVMLVTEGSSVPPPNTNGRSTIYWLDYDVLSKGGRLSFALNATFDANELPADSTGLQKYYVPDGCNACHGDNTRRALVNYLDTDHWFDRLESEFPTLRASGQALLFDGRTNDVSAASYKLAFDVIRRFNIEADEQVRKAQPRHAEAFAAAKWLELHQASNEHFLPVQRAIGVAPRWAAGNTDDVAALNALNQYCFRCHGTVKFSVFDRQSLVRQTPKLRDALRVDAPAGIRMPPDRDLPDAARIAILKILP
jgi:hypothetical protein